MSQPILEIKALKKHYHTNKGFWGKSNTIHAVDGIDLSIYEGETISLVGESGCGKSTTGRSILRLIEPTNGEILFQGKDILDFNTSQMRKVRRDMQFIFQNPFASLNPRKTISQILNTPLIIHNIGTPKERKIMVEEIIETVGLSRKYLDRYPHEFSGGQRQRIGIARALILKPKLIIADEPVSALDVSIQAQILNLLKDLQQQFNLTYLFISHDLSVVKHISDRVAVMYLGKIVEVTDKKSLFSNPMHPYTKALLSAVPVADPENQNKRIILEGDIPSPANPPKGCAFHPRCAYSMEICSQQTPVLREVQNGHSMACYLSGD